MCFFARSFVSSVTTSQCSIVFIMNIFKGKQKKRQGGRKGREKNRLGRRNEVVSIQFAWLRHNANIMGERQVNCEEIFERRCGIQTR